MLNKIKDHILKLKLIVFLIDASKKVILPGFDGMPLYDVTIFFIKGVQKGAVTTRASSLAFKFFLALFPGIIFLFTLIPYIPIDNFHEQLLNQLQVLMPDDVYILTKTTMEDLINYQRGGLLSFGFIFTLYFATNGINAMIQAFNESYFTVEKRSVLKQRLVSIVLFIILTLLAVVAVALIIISGFVLDFLVKEGIIEGKFTIYLLQIGKWIVILALFFFTISFLYYLGPSKRTKWKFISAGSTLATLLMIIVSSGFAYYVNNFGQYNKLYGSIGTLMVIMLWIYFNSLILLIGFDLNASIQNIKTMEQ